MGYSLLFKLSTIASGAGVGSSSLAALNPGDSSGTGYSFWDTLKLMLGTFVIELLTRIWEVITTLIYTIGKWVLVVIDFIFIFIRQIIGMNADFEASDNFSESDIIFKFIFNDTVIRVIRGMIGLAIIMLIVFCIFAIIKSEYDYFVNGGGNSKKEVLVRGLKSVFLMFLVPVISIGGIILSNALLKSLYMATSGGADTSMGAQIFVSSSFNANAYRFYADSNLKRPITYNFSEVTDEDNVTSWNVPGGVEDLNNALIAFREQDVWTRGLSTYIMEQTNSFLQMSSVDRLDEAYKKEGLESPYHSSYDKGLYTKRAEYYVMADVVDYNIKQRNTLYIRTAEEIYESYHKILDDTKISQQARNEVKTFMPIIKTQNDQDGKTTYNFSIKYTEDDAVTTYSHAAGATDEALGAVFLMAFQEEVHDGDKTYYYYYPLMTANEGFATDHIVNADQPIIAKGMFEDGKNPTALKIEDNVVKCYRDDLNIPTLLDLFPVISYESPPEGTTRDLGMEILKYGVQVVTGVDMNQFIPYIYYNFDIFSLFSKQTYNIIKINDGMIQLDYTFGQKGITIQNVYKMSEFNVFILMLASVIILGMLIAFLFGIARRVLDITLLAITYPAVLSTYPIDGGGRFSGWVKTFVNKLLSIYGVVIGINIVLMLVPTIDGLNLITPSMIAEATQVHSLPWTFTAYYANELIELLFIVVAFASIKGFGKTIEHLITGVKLDDAGGVIASGEQVVNDLKKLPQKVGDIVSGKVIIDTVEKTAHAAIDFIPGAAALGEAKEKVDQMRLMHSLKADAKDARKTLKSDSGTVKDDSKADQETDGAQNGVSEGATQASESSGGGGANIGEGGGGANIGEGAGEAAAAIGGGEGAGEASSIGGGEGSSGGGNSSLGGGEGGAADRAAESASDRAADRAAEKASEQAAEEAADQEAKNTHGGMITKMIAKEEAKDEYKNMTPEQIKKQSEQEEAMAHPGKAAAKKAAHPIKAAKEGVKEAKEGIQEARGKDGGDSGGDSGGE